jgi:hypothetical protein
MDQKPIITPPDWNADKDFESHEERFGEPQDYFGDVLQRVADDYAGLIDAVDSALRYFERKDPCLVPVHLETLTLDEKLHRLSSITNTADWDFAYKARFGEHINDCRWVDYERSRIMMNYYVGEEKPWLKLLGHIADAIGCAANELNEAMKVEHEDYGHE